MQNNVIQKSINSCKVTSELTVIQITVTLYCLACILQQGITTYSLAILNAQYLLLLEFKHFQNTVHKLCFFHL